MAEKVNIEVRVQAESVEELVCKLTEIMNDFNCRKVVTTTEEATVGKPTAEEAVKTEVVQEAKGKVVKAKVEEVVKPEPPKAPAKPKQEEAKEDEVSVEALVSAYHNKLASTEDKSSFKKEVRQILVELGALKITGIAPEHRAAFIEKVNAIK